MKRSPVLPTPEVLDALIAAAMENASSLIGEADCLAGRSFWARTHFLASTALEELSKVQLIADVRAGDIPFSALRIALSSHFKKYAYLKRTGLTAPEPAPHSPALQFAQSATALRMNALYVGLDPNCGVLTPARMVTEEQARHALEVAHKELSHAELLSSVPGGLSTKGTQAFAARREKGGA